MADTILVEARLYLVVDIHCATFAEVELGSFAVDDLKDDVEGGHLFVGGSHTPYALVNLREHLFLERTHGVEDVLTGVESADDSHSAFFGDPEAGARCVDDLGEYHIQVFVVWFHDGRAEGLHQFFVALVNEIDIASFVFHIIVGFGFVTAKWIQPQRMAEKVSVKRAEKVSHTRQVEKGAIIFVCFEIAKVVIIY